MLTELCKDVEVAVEDISKETRHDLWRAIGEWEDRLAEKSLAATGQRSPENERKGSISG